MFSSRFGGVGGVLLKEGDKTTVMYSMTTILFFFISSCFGFRFVFFSLAHSMSVSFRAVLCVRVLCCLFVVKMISFFCVCPSLPLFRSLPASRLPLLVLLISTTLQKLLVCFPTFSLPHSPFFTLASSCLFWLFFFFLFQLCVFSCLFERKTNSQQNGTV